MTADSRKQPSSSGKEQPPAAQPRRHWAERWRERLPKGSWRRARYDGFFLPIEPPAQFTEPHDELVERLTPLTDGGQPDGERSKEVLAEAQAILAEADARAEGAERRATTLQGAVAIATTVLLAGGTLLGDPTKIHGNWWRILLALALLTVTVCLVMAGARALAATSRIHVFHRPTPADILRRAGLPSAEARIELAAEALKDYGFNNEVAKWKVAYLGAAAWWFRGALAALLVLAALLAAYVGFGPDSDPVSKAPRSHPLLIAPSPLGNDLRAIRSDEQPVLGTGPQDQHLGWSFLQKPDEIVA